MQNGFNISNAGRTIFAATLLANRIAVKPLKGTLAKPEPSSGICLSWSVFNHGSSQYIQLHIGADIDPGTGPALGRAPQFVIFSTAGSGPSYDTPIRFENSFWLCNSSTRDTLTPGGPDCAWIAHLA